ncbi:MAG: histidine kinase dimerization/phospho-acceptor domain-containing protein [Vulcanimicrobiaceae bacterium]
MAVWVTPFVEGACARFANILGASHTYITGTSASVKTSELRTPPQTTTPKPLRTLQTDRQDELGRLATAYNGAIETVDKALCERARAEQQMRQFIADAGHQLQTPLTVLRGFIGILRRGEVRSPGNVPRILDTMDRQSALMAALIKKLMLLQDWEQSADMAAEPIDVGPVVREIVAPIAEANPGQAIRMHLAENAWARVSATELTYAISNLVDNAIKYAPSREIDVRVACKTGWCVSR